MVKLRCPIALLQSYTREGVLQVLSVLSDDSLPSELCIYVVKFPIIEIISDRDCVKLEELLRAALWGISSVASVLTLKGIGDLSPLEAPHALADTCEGLLRTL